VRGAFDLVWATAAIPGAFVGGLLTLALAGRGRVRIERTIGRARGRAAAAGGRVLGVVAILLAVAGAIAIVTFLLLERYAQ